MTIAEVDKIKAHLDKELGELPRTMVEHATSAMLLTRLTNTLKAKLSEQPKTAVEAKEPKPAVESVEQNDGTPS
jgi:hypothetical protein